MNARMKGVVMMPFPFIFLVVEGRECLLDNVGFEKVFVS